MEEHEDLVERLRTLGQRPVPTGTRDRAFAATGGGDGRRPSRTWSRPAVIAAALAGFAFGSVGLASAGALPGPMQDAAHTVLAHVGVNVPPGHERFNDPSACPGGPYENHGAYVRQHAGDPEAGQSPCGKPVKATDHSDDNASNDSTSSAPPDGGEHGNSKNHPGNEQSGAGNQPATPNSDGSSASDHSNANADRSSSDHSSSGDSTSTTADTSSSSS